MEYENRLEIVRAREVLDILLARPRKAYEIVELSGLSFDETHEVLEWLRAKGYAGRLDIIGELYPDWIALRSLE